MKGGFKTRTETISALRPKFVAIRLFFTSRRSYASRKDNFNFGHETSGFTIVETMIVLAVTGMIFLSAATLINGKEAKVQFTTAIQNAQQQIQQVIGEVQSGYYASGSTSGIKCVASSGSFIISSGGSQGTNSPCLFLGKAMQFGSAPSNGSQPFNVYTIVGNRTDGSGNEATSLAAANPTVISSSYSHETVNLQYGLTAAWIKVGSGGGHDTPTADSVIFLNDLGSTSGSGDLISGAQAVDVYALTGSIDLGSQRSIAANLAASTANPAGGVQICLNSGTTKQSGLITIGGSSGATNVILKVYSSAGCS